MATFATAFGVAAESRVAYDLATLADLKSFIGISVKDDDTLLTRLLGVASSWIRTFIDHDVFPVKEYTDPIIGRGAGDTLWLIEWPVVSITSLIYEDGRAIPERPLGTQQQGYWLELPNIVHLVGYRIPRGQRAFCTYRAGWEAVPPESAQACIDIAAYEYKRRTRIAQNSKNLPAETVTFDTEWASKYAQAILRHWQRVAPKAGGLT